MKKISILNIFIFLFVLSLVVLFGPFGHRGSSWDGLGGAFYILLYLITSFLMIIRLYKNRNTPNLIRYRFVCLLFLAFIGVHYQAIISAIAKEPIYLFHPALFPSILILFLFFIRKTKFFYVYLTLFFAMPLSIIVKKIYHKMS